MDSITKYYNEICKIPMLNRAEEEALFTEYYAPETTLSRRDAIRETVINSNLRFVFKTARNFAKNEIHLLDDLISAGNEGLLVGFEKYNPECGVKFLSYAGWWVQQRILNTMSKVRIVALPVWKQQLAAKIQKAKDNNEEITLDQLSEDFPQIPQKDIAELFSTKYLTFHINDLDQTSPEFELTPVEDVVEEGLDADVIRKSVAQLPSPHKEVISCVFGLSGDKQYKPHQLAKKIGVPRDTLETLQREGLDLLRELMNVRDRNV